MKSRKDILLKGAWSKYGLRDTQQRLNPSTLLTSGAGSEGVLQGVLPYRSEAFLLTGS